MSVRYTGIMHVCCVGRVVNIYNIYYAPPAMHRINVVVVVIIIMQVHGRRATYIGNTP